MEKLNFVEYSSEKLNCHHCKNKQEKVYSTIVSYGGDGYNTFTRSNLYWLCQECFNKFEKEADKIEVKMIWIWEGAKVEKAAKKVVDIKISFLERGDFLKN